MFCNNILTDIYSFTSEELPFLFLWYSNVEKDYTCCNYVQKVAVKNKDNYLPA